jgi:hypothetical protein
MKEGSRIEEEVEHETMLKKIVAIDVFNHGLVGITDLFGM